MKKAYLVLENGKIFEGIAMGATGTAEGELVFTTGAVGYTETLSDPAFKGQIILSTFPSVGNYGVMEADLESASTAAGYVVRDICAVPSNFRTDLTLDAFLKKAGIVGICGVDTREITKILRDSGSLSAMILPEKPENIPAFSRGVTHLVKEVSRKEKTVFAAEGEEIYKVSLLDLGATKSLIESLTKRGCRVTVYPYNTKAEEILGEEPDGVVLSGGPGNPSVYTSESAEIGKLFGKVPLFGVGLGHQLLAQSLGGICEKMPKGHRGANYPVSLPDKSRTYITNQNHGYTVRTESLAEKAELLFINANDGTAEGFTYPGKNSFSVQFTPDMENHTDNTAFLWDAFIKRMGGEENATR